MVMISREKEILNRLRDCIVDLAFDDVEGVAREAIDAGIPAYRAVTEGMAKGMEIVGQKFEEKEYFLAELIVSGDVMKKGMSVFEPYLKGEGFKASGKVVIGTVEGDLHDIGKNIVATLLIAQGFTVIDLGVDVPAKKFVEVVREEEPDILGLSALLSVCVPEMGNVIKTFEREGLRGKVKIIVGGATVTEEVATKIRADRRAEDAVDGVNICREWIREKRGL